MGLSRAFFKTFLYPIPKYVLKTHEAAYRSCETLKHCCAVFMVTLAPSATQERGFPSRLHGSPLPPRQRLPRAQPRPLRAAPDGGSATAPAGTPRGEAGPGGGGGDTPGVGRAAEWISRGEAGPGGGGASRQAPPRSGGEPGGSGAPGACPAPTW